MEENNLEDLLFDSSKETVVRASHIIQNDGKLFREMLDIALANKPKISARASRSICETIQRDDQLAIPYFRKILNEIQRIDSESVIFNLLHIFALSPLPDDEDDLGWLTKTCFDWMERNVQRIAIKVYALVILERIARIYPEISGELIAMIESQIPHLSPAFKSRGKKTIEKLKRNL